MQDYKGEWGKRWNEKERKDEKLKTPASSKCVSLAWNSSVKFIQKALRQCALSEASRHD